MWDRFSAIGKTVKTALREKVVPAKFETETLGIRGACVEEKGYTTKE